MNAPLAVAALILWLLLAFLAIRVCRRWAKERNAVSIIYKNHSAIPVKQYQLANFEADVSMLAKSAGAMPSPKLSAEQQAQRLASLRDAWDT